MTAQSAFTRQVSIRRDAPVMGRNFQPGYIGFSFPVDPGVVSKGICYLTRWNRMSDIRVSHAFIIENSTFCIEADMERGVIRTPLSHYFEGDYYVYIRKPAAYSTFQARNIITAALEQFGKPYDKALIASHLMLGSVPGHIANALLWHLPERIMCNILDDGGKWICSELAAYCLSASPLLHDLGILREPPATITPQELFEDDEVFTPWHKDPYDD